MKRKVERHKQDFFLPIHCGHFETFLASLPDLKPEIESLAIGTNTKRDGKLSKKKEETSASRFRYRIFNFCQELRPYRMISHKEPNAPGEKNTINYPVDTLDSFSRAHQLRK